MKLSHRVRKRTVERHLQALRLVRTRRIIRTIPKTTGLRIARVWQHYTIVATGQLGKRRLARLVLPWQPRPPQARATPVVGISKARRQLLRAMRESGARTMRGRPLRERRRERQAVQA